MQQHVQEMHSGSRAYGAPTVDVVNEGPSSRFKPGSRVSWSEGDNTVHGTVWAEAPTMGNKPHRHVVPDGMRGAIPLPISSLTQTAGSLEASRAGQFHSAAAQTTLGPIVDEVRQHTQRGNRARAAR
jgi:hypothetical protein